MILTQNELIKYIISLLDSLLSSNELSFKTAQTVQTAKVEVIKFELNHQKKVCPSRAGWNTQEIEFLKKNFGKLPHYRIAEHLNRTPNAVKTYASKLGLKSAQEWRKKQ